MILEKRNFLTGAFVVWKNRLYRAKTIRDGYVLFHLKDTDGTNPLCQIAGSQAEDAYYQSAYCDLKGVRYRAVSVQDEFCEYQLFHDKEYYYRDRIEDMTEIWIRHNRLRQNPEIETVWIRPYCMNPPSCQKFYAQKRADMNLMISWTEKLLGFRKAAECLKALYQDRISIVETEHPFWDTCVQIFRIDSQELVMTLDFGIIDISPKEKAGNVYIPEIVKYFNRFS